MNQKPLFASSLILVILLSISCTSFKEVGKVNMISTRNIDSKSEYKLLTTYSGGSEKDLRKSRAKTIEQAINETVRRTIGGEYLMNAKIYLVDERYYAIEGDVWGKENNEKEIAVNGFRVGDKVTWKKAGTYKTGKIIALKDKVCLVEQDENQKTIEMDYYNLTKIQ
ncbi:MAG: hypothetical protein HS119_13335 [Flavobacteriales bacterium]|nr:hypothetical protein [Flavobacteriales bacterium]MCL4855998.1 hypothetical protein [Flavobacteriales bacterium]